METTEGQKGITREDGVLEVDPNQLVRKDGILGFERGSRFEEVTNFDIEVAGYVGDHGHVIGYILLVVIAVTDPLDAAVNASKYVSYFQFFLMYWSMSLMRADILESGIFW